MTGSNVDPMDLSPLRPVVRGVRLRERPPHPGPCALLAWPDDRMSSVRDTPPGAWLAVLVDAYQQTKALAGRDPGSQHRCAEAAAQLRASPREHRHNVLETPGD